MQIVALSFRASIEHRAWKPDFRLCLAPSLSMNIPHTIHLHDSQSHV